MRMYHGIVTVEHPVLTEEEYNKRYQHCIDVCIEETKKAMARKAMAKKVAGEKNGNI